MKSGDFLQRRIATLRKDPGGSICWVVETATQQILLILDSIWNLVIAKLWGIDIAFSCRFLGITHFKKYPGSQIRIGRNCIFRSSFRSNFFGLNHPCGISTHSKESRIEIGNNCGLSGAIIGARESILLGENVLCGANAVITDFDWHPMHYLIEQGDARIQSRPVVIGDNVWLGANSIVLKGVTIGSNSIIGAHSVVTSSIPANVVAAGNPAKVIRHLNDSSCH